MIYPHIIGTYYTFLGWLSLAGLVTNLLLAVFTDSLILDFSFILWFWLGSALKRQSPAARKWAIGISILGALVIFIALIFGDGQTQWEIPNGTIMGGNYYVLLIGLFVFVCLPGLLLLNPRAKDQFTPGRIILPLPAASLPLLPHDVTGTWLPTRAEVDKVLPAIKDYIQTNNPAIYANLDKYHCQFFGIIKEGGKRLYCNYFWHRAWEKEWLIYPVISHNGGDWFFRLEVDLATGQCFNFAVNPSACNAEDGKA